MDNTVEILTIDALSVAYGGYSVLNEVSFGLCAGEILLVVGQNGSGKSTLLKAICGLIPKNQGTILFNHSKLSAKPHQLTELGISCFLQGGLVMSSLTIAEHLHLASAFGKPPALEAVYASFPSLYQVRNQKAGNLSGGQRQMLSFGILIMQQTKIWLLDEPTAGLAPSIVDFTMRFLQEKNKTEGISMLIVEHNMEVAIRLASHIIIAKDNTVTRKYNQLEFCAENFLASIYN
jgi:ABC-type branched-subunit amino acid transport system ATPase component